MKKLFILSVLSIIFPFLSECSEKNPFENLKTELEIHKNLDELYSKTSILSENIEDYYETCGYSKNSIRLDPFCEDGIQQILKNVERIRETDKTSSIFLFFDIDKFTFWKDGDTPSIELREENLDNYYVGEEHTSLFRDSKFPEVIKELKKLGCRIHGLTARYGRDEKYSQKKIMKIEKMCQNLQFFIDFDLFPEDFQHRNYPPHNLSDNLNVQEPLLAFSGIFLTGEKTKSIKYLLENGKKLKFFEREKKPSYVIFGDDCARNLYNMDENIQKQFNVTLYHWPYPDEVDHEILPIVKMYKNDENSLNALKHMQYMMTSCVSLSNFILDSLGDIENIGDDKHKIPMIKIVIDALFYEKIDHFIDNVDIKNDKNIDIIMSYLKWKNVDHWPIQKSIIDNALASCIFNIGKKIYKRFYDKHDQEESHSFNEEVLETDNEGLKDKRWTELEESTRDFKKPKNKSFKSLKNLQKIKFKEELSDGFIKYKQVNFDENLWEEEACNFLLNMGNYQILEELPREPEKMENNLQSPNLSLEKQGQYTNLYDDLLEYFESIEENLEMEFFEKNYPYDEKILDDLVRELIRFYAHTEGIENSEDLFKHLDTKAWQETELN